VPIPHAGGVHDPKPHFQILAGILAIDVDWKDGFGTSFENSHSALTELTKLNCGLAVDGHAFDTFEQDGGYTYCKSENALVYFLFRLLNQLQTLGTVPAIDWNAYAAQLARMPAGV
jgi:hypothetical protein